MHSEFWDNLGYVVRFCLKKQTNGLLRASEMAQEGQSTCCRACWTTWILSLGLTWRKETTHSANCVLIYTYVPGHVCSPIRPLLTKIKKCVIKMLLVSQLGLC